MIISFPVFWRISLVFSGMSVNPFPLNKEIFIPEGMEPLEKDIYGDSFMNKAGMQRIETKRLILRRFKI